MAKDFLLNVVAIEAGCEPNWDAALQRIERLRVDDLDEFFGYWDPDGDSKNDAASDDAYLPRLKGELRAELDGIRRSFGRLSPDGTAFEFSGFRFLATGGPSVGSVPTALYDSISRLHAVGALEAAGFAPVCVDGTNGESVGER